MDIITNSQSTVLSIIKEDSLNKKGSFNSSGVSTLNTEPTRQVRQDSSEWLARPAGIGDMHARLQSSVGAKLFESAKPGVVPEWIIKAKAIGDHGESARNNISPAHQPGVPG